MLQRVGADELAVGEVEAGMGVLDLCEGLAQLDLVGGGVDLEQEVSLVDDVAILEADLGKGAADLGAQLDALDGRELAEELEAAGDVALPGRGRGGRRGQQLRSDDDTAGVPGRPVGRESPNSGGMRLVGPHAQR
jgi:hypothetical protein